MLTEHFIRLIIFVMLSQTWIWIKKILNQSTPRSSRTHLAKQIYTGRHPYSSVAPIQIHFAMCCWRPFTTPYNDFSPINLAASIINQHKLSAKHRNWPCNAQFIAKFVKNYPRITIPGRSILGFTKIYKCIQCKPRKKRNSALV